MKVLLINDQSICSSHSIFEIFLQQNGHETLFIDAREVWSERFCGYSPDTVEEILSSARAFRPNWVYMVLQGWETTGQVLAAIAIHKEFPETKFLFTSGHDHEKELQVARDRGMKLEFQYIPIRPQDFLDIIAGKKRPSTDYVQQQVALSSEPSLPSEHATPSWLRRILGRMSMIRVITVA